MWQELDNKLTKTFIFQNFLEALAFVNQVGSVAESLGHHPEIWFTWGKVTIATTTHDEGNSITEKDRKLILEIDKLN